MGAQNALDATVSLVLQLEPKALMHLLQFWFYQHLVETSFVDQSAGQLIRLLQVFKQVHRLRFILEPQQALLLRFAVEHLEDAALIDWTVEAIQEAFGHVPAEVV